MVEKEDIYQLLSTLFNFKTILSLKKYPENSYNFNGFSREILQDIISFMHYHFVILPSYLYICSLATCNMIGEDTNSYHNEVNERCMKTTNSTR